MEAVDPVASTWEKPVGCPVEGLERRLGELAGLADAEWLAGLPERKREESTFHDRRRVQEQAGAPGRVGAGLYEAAALSSRHVAEWIEREAPGAVFLDYGCGRGGDALLAARAGARLAVGIDLSGESIALARDAAREAGLGSRARFLQCDAEESRLPSESIDRVVCRGVLHHLDLEPCLKELYRILAPGGRVLALEALGYNPALRLCRELTPARRTRWERSHVLTPAQLRAARGQFEVEDMRFWHLASVLSIFAPPLRPALDRLDRVLTRVPLVQLAAWMFSFELVKPPCGSAEAGRSPGGRSRENQRCG
jgi:SAM-dependent methyltransferase